MGIALEPRLYAVPVAGVRTLDRWDTQLNCTRGPGCPREHVPDSSRSHLYRHWIAIAGIRRCLPACPLTCAAVSAQLTGRGALCDPRQGGRHGAGHVHEHPRVGIGGSAVAATVSSMRLRLPVHIFPHGALTWLLRVAYAVSLSPGIGLCVEITLREYLS